MRPSPSPWLAWLMCTSAPLFGKSAASSAKQSAMSMMMKPPTTQLQMLSGPAIFAA